MMINDFQNQSYQHSEHTFSNNSFKSHQNRQNLKEECAFCRTKPTILKQLEVLREAVLIKNQKIKELEGFIQKISKMAFMSSTDGSDNHFTSSKNYIQSHPFQQLTFAQCSVSPKNQSHVNSFAHEDSMRSQMRTQSRQSLGSSQVMLAERQQIKNSIKREVKKLNVDKKDKEAPSLVTVEYPKQSPLRAKLMSIMNLLPQSQNDSRLQSFQTESEPMVEGPVALVNSKVSNHKIVKHAGFIKKGETLDHSLNSTHKSDKFKRTAMMID